MSLNGPHGDPNGARADRPVVLGFGPLDRLVIFGGAPLAGIALGYFLPAIARWATTLPWTPFEGPLRLFAQLDGYWVTLVTTGAGLILGLGFAWVAYVEMLRVTLTPDEMRLDRDGKTRTVPRAEVDAVFLDGKVLVALDRESRQIVREKLEGRPDAIAAAFSSRGYPWTDRDPYGELYRRWVRDLPDLPPAVNAVLVAREAALAKKSASDVAELREEVQKAGFVVREDGTNQYWRPLVRS
ncbi:YqeB family protein [Allonocardiopsis opalescens]|uniref:DUF308 domain-containing protein n=1 Tax=Allonocardiopsis opalescens TaxID=1144618 RepID=A0A2T0PX52_9ACTN|nr:hypothetical protein [Allonocardiopsis opalescens]PRX96120.1 hypothetical protein CLV72_108126 [Allonocardiopsis opalescens]